MPYFIAKDRDGCKGGWAVVDEAGDILGCHGDKQSAIDQAVAVSIATEEPFEGERAAVGELSVGDYVQWTDGEDTMFGEVYKVEGTNAQVKIYEDSEGIYIESMLLALVPVADLTKIADLPTVEDAAVGDAQANIADIDGTLVTFQGDKNEKVYAYFDSFEDTELIIITARLESERTDTVAELDSLDVDYDQLLMKPNADLDSTDWKKQTAEKLLETYNVMVAVDDNADIRAAYSDLGITAISPADVPDVPEARAIDQEAPAYMRAAARRGLAYYEQGLAGDGVVDRTIAEARQMVSGTVSDDKWIRIAAWIARHLTDLDSPDANPSSDNYPSAGVVAHLLWGSGPTKRAAERTQAYAESVVARIRAEQERDSMTTDNRAKWADVATAIVDRLEGRAKPKHEERVNVIDLEVRETGDGMTFEGYAAVFNSESEDLGGFREFIAPGAFKRSLQSRNEVKLLWNHDAGEPLASVRGGTLKLTEDARGLKVEARLANTSRGRDVAELIRSKTVDSMSFGFSVIKDTWNAEGNVRTLNAVRLFEISMVSFPAYQATAGTVSVRSSNTIDADQLADALFKLESGEELDPTAASLITEVVAKLTKTEEVQEVQGDILALKQKKLNLLLKGM
jgi:uncharacterized protein